jgi:hypothetical protein
MSVRDSIVVGVRSSSARICPGCLEPKKIRVDRLCCSRACGQRINGLKRGTLITPCETCGIELRIQNSRPNKRFCSIACRSLWRSQKMLHGECAECGVELRRIPYPGMDPAWWCWACDPDKDHNIPGWEIHGTGQPGDALRFVPLASPSSTRSEGRRLVALLVTEVPEDL